MSSQRSAAAQAERTAKERAEAANAESIKHLRAAVSLTEESKTLGAESAESLARQRESIQRSLVKADEVDAHNAKAKHILRGMGSMWGAFKNLFRRAPKDAEEVAQEREAQRAARLAAAGGGGGAAQGAAQGGAQSSSSGSTGAAASGASAPPRSEAEELLQTISGNLGALKAVGQKINDEMRLQDGMLDELEAKVDKSGAGLKKNTKESTRQARS